jgi:tetratricopeptide (TPR) repeat protein
MINLHLPLALLVTALLVTASTQPAVEATSLLGISLNRPAIALDRRAKLEDDLARAKADYDARPDSEDAAIWYGRRLAYLGRYRDAIDVFSKAIAQHPQSYKLLRHRGHRYITVRELDKAIADLTRAAELSKEAKDELEPDGAPNARNVPRSTNLSNIWYHLALAHYLKGDFQRAAQCWRQCMDFARVNDDMDVATSYWLYLSLRRIGANDEAKLVLGEIKPHMDVIENGAYHRLLRMFKGELSEAQLREGGTPDDAIADATIGYGLGVWQLINGDAAAARKQLDEVLRSPNWAPFGYIAAEAEVARTR